ncbi:hypothetical protein MBANPS3_008688 [Mucor bainieri]
MLVIIYAPYRKRIEITAESTTTIQQIKQTIFQRYGISTYLQHLYFEGKILENEGTTLRCYINEDPFVYPDSYSVGISLVVDNQMYSNTNLIQVFVLHPTGKTYAYDLPQSATVEMFKKMINDREDGPSDSRRFYLFHGSDYFVYNESTIQMNYKPRHY